MSNRARSVIDRTPVLTPVRVGLARCRRARGAAARHVGAGIPDGLVAYGRFLPTYTERAEVPLRRRRDELVDRRIRAVERRAELSRRRQGRGVERAAGHAAAAHARSPLGAVGSRSAVGAGRRLRRRRDGGLVRAAPGHQADRDLRDRAADPAVVSTYFTKQNYDVVERSARGDRLRRRAALHPDDEGEVRRHHVGPDPSVGEGRGDALHEGVLRAGEAAPEPRRRGDAVGAALREHPDA